MEQKDILEIKEDRRFDNRTYKVKLVGKVLLLIIIILAVAGFTGKGPVSKYTAGEAGLGAMVTTQKYARYESSLEIEMLVNTVMLNNGDSTLDISFPESYLAQMQIESILPEPQEMIISNDRVICRFALKDPGETQSIYFYMLPQRLFKTLEGTVKIEDKAEIHLEHFIYP